MKKHTFKRIGAAAVLLGGLVQVAQAHTIASGLGAAPGSADQWYLLCPSTTAKVVGSVKETLTPGDATQINLQVISLHVPGGAANTTAPNTGAFSGTTKVAAKGGVYRVLVDKTAGTAEAYSATVHCLNASEVEVTQGEPVLLQNH